MEDYFKQHINDLASDKEWWDESNRDTVLGIALDLYNMYNIDEEDITDIVTKFYNAVAAEFGG